MNGRFGRTWVKSGTQPWSEHPRLCEYEGILYGGFVHEDVDVTRVTLDHGVNQSELVRDLMINGVTECSHHYKAATKNKDPANKSLFFADVCLRSSR